MNTNKRTFICIANIGCIFIPAKKNGKKFMFDNQRLSDNIQFTQVHGKTDFSNTNKRTFFCIPMSFICGQITSVDSREHKRADVAHGNKSGPVTGLVREARLIGKSVYKVYKVLKVHKVVLRLGFPGVAYIL